MSLIFRTKALSLKEKEWEETGLIFSLFTENLGRVEVVAKGARKISSKLRGHIIPFSLVDIEFVQGKYNKILTDVYLIKRFYNINSSPFRFLLIQKLLNIFFNLTLEESEDRKLWDLLLFLFQSLDKKECSPYFLKIIYYYFLWNFFSVLGFAPELFYCILCQKKLKPEKLFFYSEGGGVLCYDCYQKNKILNVLTISPQIVKIIRKILEGDFKEVLKIKIQPHYFLKLKEISKNYYFQIKKEDEETL